MSLREHHGDISLNSWQKLVEYADGLTLVNPSQTRIPDEPIPIIEGLTVINGFRCISCGALYPKDTSMETHCRGKHGWTLIKGQNQLHIGR
jgi:hypothetical protein